MSQEFTGEIKFGDETIFVRGVAEKDDNGGEPKPPPTEPPEGKTWTPVEVEYRQEMSLDPDRPTNYHVEIKGDCSLAVNPKEVGATGYITIVNGEGHKVTVTDWGGNALMHITDTQILGYYIPASEFLKIKVI